MRCVLVTHGEDGLVGQWVVQLVSRTDFSVLVNRLVGQTVGGSVIRSVRWPLGQSFVQSIGPLLGWSVGRLVGRLVSQPVCWLDRLLCVGHLFGRLDDGLFGGLVGQPVIEAEGVV